MGFAGRNPFAMGALGALLGAAAMASAQLRPEAPEEPEPETDQQREERIQQTKARRENSRLAAAQRAAEEDERARPFKEAAQAKRDRKNARRKALASPLSREGREGE